MKRNIGSMDRLLRLAIGLILLLAAWYYTSWLLLALAIFCFYEALIGWCAFYQIIGKNSCSIDSNRKK